MQTEADRIATAIQRIRDGAMLRPASKRAAYVAENIRRQQENAQRFVMARKPPAGWSVGLHEQMLHALVALEAEFRNAGRVAA
ncbi:hypothetical protein [Shinella sp. JR1-6]|uniref:hypothetical protein n=1 Tax=Shinella sp. JR1-6 TaxID=2527671 RepID=UPI00102D47C9|nr:hypothetical protein [Shinella sp. JR1-6]TAA54054.1 hypothetical protein EXZ48_27465 [Shinella sp. JR1-6]